VTPKFHRDPAGTTFFNVAGNDAAAEESIGIEFDSDETIDHYRQSHIWNIFHQDVDAGDIAAAATIDRHDAVVIGLMGIGEMHDVYAETHPVHAIAIREGLANSALPINPADDRWFFFARNWGDEGECSHLQHYLLTNQITLQFPPPSVQHQVATVKDLGPRIFASERRTLPCSVQDSKAHF
jgi:hypothetical protein